MKPGWEGWRLAHLGQVSEELPKFEDNKKDEKGRHGSGNLRGRDKQRVKASPGVGASLAEQHACPDGHIPTCACSHLRPTCVLPPVLSCTKLRDMEQLTGKHWKKPPMRLLRPRATSSCWGELCEKMPVC